MLVKTIKKIIFPLILILIASVVRGQDTLNLDTLSFLNCDRLAPKTSVIPILTTGPTENTIEFSGSLMQSRMVYYSFKDHDYNKVYLVGQRIQSIDYSNLTGGLPTATNYVDLFYGTVQRLEQSMSDFTNRIYFSTFRDGIYSIDRSTGMSEKINPVEDDTTAVYQYVTTQDIVVDNENNLLYASVFLYKTGSSGVNNPFYGLLELDLVTGQKNWITTTSNPVSIPNVRNVSHIDYWNGHNIYLDSEENKLYFSTGYGLWWWDRNDNSTGVYNKSGGIPLLSGNPQLPSDSVTHIYIDKGENDFYIGTHKGLFVWDIEDSTSKIYNTENSILGHDLVNFIDKDPNRNIIYVALEYGGLWQLDLNTEKQRIYNENGGNEVDPQLLETTVSSVSYDKIDDKLYVSTFSQSIDPGGGVWIKDFRDSIPRITTLISRDAVICSGESVPLGAFSDSKLNVTWDEAYDSLTTIVVSPDSTTTYNYTVEDEFGCTASGDITITVTDPPEIRVLNKPPVCAGDSMTLEIEAIPGATYQWEHNGDTTSTSNVVVNDLQEYTVAVTLNGCTMEETIYPELKTITVASEDRTICVTETAILSATGGDSYSWSTGETTQEIVFDPSTPGVYTLTVTAMEDGCSAMDDVVVTVEEYCPGIPISFYARAISTSEITLEWSEPSGNHQHYVIEKRNEQGVYEIVATVPVENSSWLDENLEAETVYYYRIYSEVATEQSERRNARARTFTPNQNYIAETSILSKDIRDPEMVPNLGYDDRNTTWNYLNGLGSDIQTVIEGASPTQKDVIQPIIFDKFGMRKKHYLSYTVSQSTKPGNFRGEAEDEVIDFYANPPAAVAQSDYPYSYTLFDNSPQSKVLAQASPGEDWEINSDHIIHVDKTTNGSTDVPKWEFVGNELKASGYYAIGQLSKSLTVNEDDEQATIYKDMLGRELMRSVELDGESLITYFIYNDRGSLLFRIPPKVAANITSGFPKVIDQNTLMSACYSFKYDAQERLIEEKGPDKESVFYVYDEWDRLVLSQSGNQRLVNQWSFTKYDRLGRPVLSGLYNAESAFSQAAMKTEVDDYYAQPGSVRFETYGGPVLGYTNQSFPDISDQWSYLSVSYFDNYNFMSDDASYHTGYQFASTALGCMTVAQGMYCFESEPFKLVQGKLTGSKTRVVNQSQWLNSVVYYDDKGRTIQAVAQNHRGSVDRMSSIYSFTSWLLATKNEMTGPDGTDYAIKRRYVYDHTGRLKEGYHELFKNGVSQGEVFLAENNYNELGELIEKNLHIEEDIPLQSIDYRYTIRGWLKSINDPGLEVKPGVNEDDDNLDLFGMDFFYNERLMGVPEN